MQSLTTETFSVLRHTTVRTMSRAQLSQLSNRDFDELKKEYVELIAGAQARIAEVMCADPWPIDGKLVLSEWQTEQLEDLSRQLDAAENELVRVSQVLEPELW